MNLSRLRKLILVVVVVTLGLGASQSAWGGFKEGLDAYDRNDYATALKEWTPLAEQGHPVAQNNLGMMYRRGVGVPQDDETAVKWWKLAAKQGHVSAQFELGVSCANGQGVKQDNVYAHMWWNIAASSGHKGAVKNRDIVAKRMTPADISAARKLTRECIRKQYKGC